MLVIKKEIQKLLAKAGIKDAELVVPPNPGMGDLAFSCFGLAKEAGKNPAEVAKELSSKLKTKSSKLLEKIEATGPYVNFYLNTPELAKFLDKEWQDTKNIGKNNFGKGKKVLIEYPSQNSHKEFHIGHLRNVCIGNTLVQLFRKSGYEVTPINYLNDFGAHVAKILWYILKTKNSKLKTQNYILILS